MTPEIRHVEHLRELPMSRKIVLPATSGKNTIKSATNIFTDGIYLYDGFDDLTDENVITGETEVTIHRLVRNGKFTEFLPQCRYFKSEDQVSIFFGIYGDLLRGEEGSTILMPFLKRGKVFVASGCLDDELNLGVRGLHDNGVWYASCLPRVVLPLAH